MYHDLTKGNISRSLLLFALPMMAGNLLQQFYNIADTLIVGRVLGNNALAAVGSAYTLMTFLTSIFLGLAMGSGALFSIYQGRHDTDSLKSAIVHSFVLIALITLIVNAIVYLFMEPILSFLKVPDDVIDGMRDYLYVIFAGLIATIIAQYVSGIGILLYVLLKCPEFLLAKKDLRFRRDILKEIFNLSSLTCVQQSVMNFGILMVQGLVNSFGSTIMAAFAHLPVQDFGNAFSTFVAQNYGAGNHDRIKKGTKQAFAISIIFSLIISGLVFLLAPWLMQIFVSASETDVISAGVVYLRVEGAFYCGIGCLFLLYGYYRAIKKAGMSVVLTILSLGTRVLLAYILSATAIGIVGIWMAIPIGWGIVDAVGLIRMRSTFSDTKAYKSKP
mgnify:CR=1 FL=1